MEAVQLGREVHDLKVKSKSLDAQEALVVKSDAWNAVSHGSQVPINIRGS